MSIAVKVKQKHTNIHYNRKSHELAKNLYPPLSTYLFESSRMGNNKQFIKLISQIKCYNQQLQKWLKNQHQIKNPIVTYHFYQNLSSRIKYVLNFSRNQKEFTDSVSKIATWFYEEKMRIRGLSKQVLPKMKSLPHYSQNSPSEQPNTGHTSLTKKDLLTNDSKYRTLHFDFIPKLQLNQYTRRYYQPLAFETNKNDKKQKNKASISSVNQNKLQKYRKQMENLMITSSSTKQLKSTISQFRTSHNQPQKNTQQNMIITNISINQPFQNQLDQFSKQRDIQKQQLLNNNLLIKSKQLQQFQQQQSNILEDSEQDVKDMKLYMRDNINEQIEYVKQLNKEPDQSTLRRSMKINQQKIRSKLQELDITRNMFNWAKIKSKHSTQTSRKLQTMLTVNKYHTLQYKKRPQSPTTINTKPSPPSSQKLPNSPPSFQMKYRSKSLPLGIIEDALKKKKLSQAFKIYGKYINHLPYNSNKFQQIQQLKHLNPQIKSMSLTRLATTTLTKFNPTIQQLPPDKYNQNTHDQIDQIKLSLLSKGIITQKTQMKNALFIISNQSYPQSNQIYHQGNNLFSKQTVLVNYSKKHKNKSKIPK